jgi:hypothetical protein
MVIREIRVKLGSTSVAQFVRFLCSSPPPQASLLQFPFQLLHLLHVAMDGARTVMNLEWCNGVLLSLRL